MIATLTTSQKNKQWREPNREIWRFPLSPPHKQKRKKEKKLATRKQKKNTDV
jgi:hypothetical protein